MKESIEEKNRTGGGEVKTVVELDEVVKEVFSLLATKDLTISEGVWVLEHLQNKIYADVKIKAPEEAL